MNLFIDTQPTVDFHELDYVMHVDDIQLDPDPTSAAFHRYIAFETGVVPIRCYFLEREEDVDNAESRTLYVEVAAESLEREPLRAPPSVRGDKRSFEERAQEMFPERRGEAYTEETYATKLDELLHVPFELTVIDNG